MPKKYRGGKGRKEKPLTEEEKEFDEIDRTEDGIAVIKTKIGIQNTQLPLYSNSPNTVYFALGKNDKPNHIGIYKDYQLVESIDFDSIRGNHYHTWGNSTFVRGKKTIIKGKKEYFNLSEKHLNLIDKFVEWRQKNG